MFSLIESALGKVAETFEKVSGNISETFENVAKSLGSYVEYKEEEYFLDTDVVDEITCEKSIFFKTEKETVFDIKHLDNEHLESLINDYHVVLKNFYISDYINESEYIATFKLCIKYNINKYDNEHILNYQNEEYSKVIPSEIKPNIEKYTGHRLHSGYKELYNDDLLLTENYLFFYEYEFLESKIFNYKTKKNTKYSILIKKSCLFKIIEYLKNDFYDYKKQEIEIHEFKYENKKSEYLAVIRTETLENFRYYLFDKFFSKYKKIDLKNFTCEFNLSEKIENEKIFINCKYDLLFIRKNNRDYYEITEKILKKYHPGFLLKMNAHKKKKECVYITFN